MDGEQIRVSEERLSLNRGKDRGSENRRSRE